MGIKDEISADGSMDSKSHADKEANIEAPIEVDSFIIDSRETTLEKASSKSVIKRLYSLFKFENGCHRRNFILTMCVYLNFIMLGWNYGVLGTAFQDLQLVLKTNVKETSRLFTMNSIGYMTGSMSFGYLFDKRNKLLLLGFTSTAIAILSAVVPWCTNYWVFLAVRVLSGMFCGGQDAAGNAKLASCWGTGGAQYMQALHFTYAFGGIISPLVTSLFMAPRIYHTGSTNVSDTTTPFGIDGQHTAFPLINVTNHVSSSSGTPALGDIDASESVTMLVELPTVVPTSESLREYGETKIHIIFLITGLITALFGCTYFVVYFLGFEKVRPFHTRQGGSNGRKALTTARNDASEPRCYPQMSTTQTVFILACIAVFMIAYGTIECKIQSFLMPFLILQLDWEKQQCAYAISLLWAFFGLGRFCGVPISRWLSSFQVLITFLSFSLVSTIVLFFGAHFRINALVWVAVPMSGWSISVIYASILTWINENVMALTSKVAGSVTLFASIGFLIDPLYIGVLMENVSPMYFTYVQMVEVCITISSLVVIAAWVRKLKVRQQRKIEKL